MNNYCTNCGEKLNKNDLICKKCNTPVVDIPDNYVTPNKKKTKKKVLMIIGIIIVSFIVLFGVKELIKLYEVSKIKKSYIIPLIEKEYKGENYKLSFSNKGRCIVSGNCKFDPVFGCDGGACDEYVYLDEDTCTAYYFKYEENGSDKSEYITAIKRNNDIYAVKDIYVYGKGYNSHNNDYTDYALSFPYKSDPIQIDRYSKIYFNEKVDDYNNSYLEGETYYYKDNLEIHLDLNTKKSSTGSFNVKIAYLNENKVEIGSCIQNFIYQLFNFAFAGSIWYDFVLFNIYIKN